DLLQEGGGEGARRLLQKFHDQAAAKRPSEGSRQRGSLEVLQHQRTRAPLNVRRESGAERMYEEDKKTAKELLIWLTKIKAESVLKDLDDILEAHFDAPEHMRDARLIPGSDVKVKICEHWSEYVWLTCQRELDEAEVFMTLS